jgi:predicted peptidase
MRTLTIALLLSLLPCASPTISHAQPAPPATATISITPGQFNPRIHREGDQSLPYQLLVPKDYAPDQAQSWPLIIFLHGSGEKGTDNTAQLQVVANTFLADGAKTRAFVLLPQCPPNMAWHGVGFNQAPPLPASSRMLIATIAELCKEFKLDDRRIYLGGFSMGGYGDWELLIRYPGLFAAAFPIAGGTGDRTGVAPLVKDIPIWAFHGDKDPNAPVADTRKIVASLQSLGSPIKYTEYPGMGHECARPLSEPQLPQWLFAQQRTAPADFTPAKLPDGALMIIKTLPAGTHDTWTGPVQHTAHGAARLDIGGFRYRLRSAPKSDPAVATTLEKIGKGELTGQFQVTGTIEIEDFVWLTVDQIESKK